MVLKVSNYWFTEDHSALLSEHVKQSNIFLVIDEPLQEPSQGCINVFVACEPEAIMGGMYTLLRDKSWCEKWDAILTTDPSIVHDQSKAHKLTIAPCWCLMPDDSYTTKYFGVTTIMSWKKSTSGQRLRHWVRDRWPQAVFGQIYCSYAQQSSLVRHYPEDRRDCFHLMFHLVIENSQQKGYYSEKLMDAFLMKCVPIYWGDPFIHEVFDTSGMILVNSGDNILQVMSSLTEEDYVSRRNAIEQNYVQALGIAQGPCKQYTQLDVILQSLLLSQE